MPNQELWTHREQRKVRAAKAKRESLVGTRKAAMLDRLSKREITVEAARPQVRLAPGAFQDDVGDELDLILL